MQSIQKPSPGEYLPYAIMYIDLLPDDGLVLQHLASNVETIKGLILAQPEEKLSYSFAPGEWTVKEILVHVIDTERIFATRALRIARGDTTPLPGFEQDNYVPNSEANQRSIADILDEYTAVRQSTLALFKYLPAAAFSRKGTSSGGGLSVHAAAYIIAGHELHHLVSIKQNYLSTPQ